MRWKLLTLICPCLLAVSMAVEVREIQVRTLRGTPIDSNYVLYNTRTRVGDQHSRTILAEDIRGLHRTGRFSFVKADFHEVDGGVVLVYVVQPLTNLREIRVTGNQRMSDKKIKKLLELERGDLVDESAVAVRMQAVEAEYRKKYYPDIAIDYRLDVNQDTGAADLVIEVEERQRQKVKEVRFTGNTVFTDKELSRVMEQKETWWMEWITPRGQYQETVLASDLAKLREKYRGQGYLDASIGEPKIIRRGSARSAEVIIEIPVVEGPIYRLGQLRINGVKAFPVQQIRQLLPVKPGGIARMVDIEASRQIIRDYYASRGHVTTTVDMQDKPHASGTLVDVVYTVREGAVARIRDVIIRGNRTTDDKVIRRELTYFPGEIYDGVRVRSSETKLRNTKLFDSVRTTQKSTRNPNEYDVVVNVEEGRTGQLLTGFGFSSTDKLIGFVELRQSNFDITKPSKFFRGGGQKLSIRAQLGTAREDIDITHVEPWFVDRKLRLTTRFFQNEYRFLSDDYDQRNVGGSVGLSKALGELWRVGLTYELKRIRVIDVDSSASELIQIEEGETLQSAGILRFTRDSRDRFFIPTEGARTYLEGKLVGGIFGADTDLYQLRLKHQQHRKLWLDHILNVQGHIRTTEENGDGDRVPIFNRLFLGGARTIRGFDFREVGPKDEFGEPIGGKSDWWVTAEYTIPVADQFRFATFYDMGMVTADAYDWDFSDFNSSVGIGVRLDIPQFPLQIDYSWPLEADAFNDRSSGRFSFLFGGTFH